MKNKQLDINLYECQRLKQVWAIQYQKGVNEDEVQRFLDIFEDYEIKPSPLEGFEIQIVMKNNPGGVLVKNLDFIVFDDAEKSRVKKLRSLKESDYINSYRLTSSARLEGKGLLIPCNFDSFTEYSLFARTSAFAEKEVGMPYTVYTALGMAGEVGEFADKVKKLHRDYKGEMSEEQQEELMLELGDVLWYLAEAARSIGTNIKRVATMNALKIKRRFANNTIHGSGDNR